MFSRWNARQGKARQDSCSCCTPLLKLREISNWGCACVRMCVRLRLRTDEGKRLLLFFFQAATAAEVLFLRGLSLDPCCYSVCLPGLCVTVVMVTWCVCYSLGLFLLKSKTRHSRGFPLPLCRVRVLVACSVVENGLALRYSKVRSGTV